LGEQACCQWAEPDSAEIGRRGDELGVATGRAGLTGGMEFGEVSGGGGRGEPDGDA
jgi:hypothetical protein